MLTEHNRTVYILHSLPHWHIHHITHVIKYQKKNSLDTHNTKLTVQQTLAEPNVIHT